MSFFPSLTCMGMAGAQQRCCLVGMVPSSGAAQQWCCPGAMLPISLPFPELSLPQKGSLHLLYAFVQAQPCSAYQDMDSLKKSRKRERGKKSKKVPPQMEEFL